MGAVLRGVHEVLQADASAGGLLACVEKGFPRLVGPLSLGELDRRAVVQNVEGVSLGLKAGLYAGIVLGGGDRGAASVMEEGQERSETLPCGLGSPLWIVADVRRQFRDEGMDGSGE
ncbi:MAG: hypothetical protein LIO63_02000 [Akkermansia sp.]|nr:hypothetical protein [Akkermansia sp.]